MKEASGDLTELANGATPAEPATLESALRLFSEFNRGLYAYARTLTGASETAEDIVQETFLRVLESRSDPRRAFLFGIARNLSRDLLRQASLKARHESAIARTLARRRAAEGKQALTEAAFAELEELPLEQREVVVLKIFGELTFEEVGDLLRIPVPTATSRYRYALEKLSARLAGRKENA